MGLGDIIDIAGRVGERDEERQEAFREEYAAYEQGDLTEFTRTREALAAERDALDALDEELASEDRSIEELVEYSEFLTVEQAVRHREQSIEKLEAHNEHLTEFHDAMNLALDAVESNLNALESAGPDAVEADPQPHFERAHAALEAHNDAVEGLDTNLTILNAYLM